MAVDYEFNPPIGIDLGTTYSAVAKWNGNKPQYYRTGAKGSKSTYQSVVWYDQKHDKYLTDRLAYKKTFVYPEFGVVGVKRFMDNRNMIIRLGDKEHSPMDISSKILAGMYNEVASMYQKEQFNARNVVVTVPYYFKAHQCANTREAVELAGLECAGIIQEPIAASLQYVMKMIEDNPTEDRDEIVLVFDLGGGTFDLTLFKLTVRKDKLSFDVLASGGDDRLGGLDFDEALANYVLEQEGIVLDRENDRSGRLLWQKIIAASIELKESLSSTEDWDIVVPFIAADQHIQRNVTRQEFELCIHTYIDRIGHHVDSIFDVAGVDKSSVTRVIKVGGSSKIPAMAELLEKKIGSNVIYGDTDTALCVAEGAAIYAAYLDDPNTFGREIEINTRASHALGIEIDGGSFFELIPSNCETPCARSQVFIPAIPNQKLVNIDIYQGSGKVAKENTKIGSFPLDIPSSEIPEPDIEVIFSQDEQQSLSVKVKIGEDVQTQVITIA